MGIQKTLARVGGDVWCSPRILALWPWPAIMFGTKGAPGGLFTPDDYREFTAWLQPGDMLVTRSRGFFLSNSFIAGAFKHLAIYVGPVSGRREGHFIIKPRWLGAQKHTGSVKRGVHERGIVHAVSEGVVCQDVLDLLGHTDYAGVIRPWQSNFERNEIALAAIERVGIEYNFDFTPKGPEASYCTELGVHCLEKAKLRVPITTEVAISLLGKKADVALADDFAVDLGLKTVSRSCMDPKFYRLSHRGDEMRKTIMKASDFLTDKL